MSEDVVGGGPRRLWVALEALYGRDEKDDDVDDVRRRRARPVTAPAS